MPDTADRQLSEQQRAMLALDREKNVTGIVTACYFYLTRSGKFQINDSNRTQYYGLAEAFHSLWRAYEVRETLPPVPQIPTHLIDTPANRRLVVLLENAVVFAERVDAEWGRTGKKMYPSDTDATDFVEYIKDIIELVRIEIHKETERN